MENRFHNDDFFKSTKNKRINRGGRKKEYFG